MEFILYSFGKHFAFGSKSGFQSSRQVITIMSVVYMFIINLGYSSRHTDTKLKIVRSSRLRLLVAFDCISESSMVCVCV